MTKSKHTPGKWYAKQENLVLWGVYEDASPDPLASVFDADNARLIAASPNLLTACKIARQHINMCIMEYPAKSFARKQAQKTLETLDAIITEAEGV